MRVYILLLLALFLSILSVNAGYTERKFKKTLIERRRNRTNSNLIGLVIYRWRGVRVGRGGSVVR